MDNSISSAGSDDLGEGDTNALDQSNGAEHEDSGDSGSETNANEGAYWSENLRLLVGLMAIWFACSFGAGILFRDFLDQFMLGGYPLGFWFAQQGSIYIFIALIFFYVVRMKQIERKYDLDD